MGTNLQKYNKALVALFAPIIVAIASRYGLSWSLEEAGLLIALITSIAVYAVPNKDKDTKAYIAELEKKLAEAKEKDGL